MNEEEARETLKTMKENIDKKYLKSRNSVAIESALNLLEKKDRQIEQYQNMLATNDMLHVLESQKKDKTIDLMSEAINNNDIDEDICRRMGQKEECNEFEDKEKCKECIKQYFENKAKEVK